MGQAQQQVDGRSSTGDLWPDISSYYMKLSNIELELKNPVRQQCHLSEKYDDADSLEVISNMNDCHSPVRTTTQDEMLSRDAHSIVYSNQHLPKKLKSWDEIMAKKKLTRIDN